jgi:hypothetical protein
MVSIIFQMAVCVQAWVIAAAPIDEMQERQVEVTSGHSRKPSSL